jgi:hypothetical protein
VQLADGAAHPGMLVDVSLSGAYVKCGIQPNVGDIVTVGTTQGRVVRRSVDGFAMEFLRLLPLESFDNRVKL